MQNIKFKVYKKSFVIKEVDLDLWKFGEAGTDPSDYGFRYDLVWSINRLVWLRNGLVWFRNGFVLFGLVRLVQILLTINSGMIWFGLVQEWFSKDVTNPSDYELRFGLVWFRNGLVRLLQILLTMGSGMV